MYMDNLAKDIISKGHKLAPIRDLSYSCLLCNNWWSLAGRVSYKYLNGKLQLVEEVVRRCPVND